MSAATLRLASTANGEQSLQLAAPLVHGRQHPKPLEVGQQRYPGFMRLPALAPSASSLPSPAMTDSYQLHHRVRGNSRLEGR